MRGGSGVADHQGQAQARLRSPMSSSTPSAPSPRETASSSTTPSANKMFNAYNNLTFPLSQVARRDRTTGDEDTVTEARGSAFRPVLSPDGTRLVYGTRVDNETGLRIRELATGEERWLKLPVQRDEQESRLHPRPDPRLYLHAGRKVRAGGLRRQDPPHRRPDRRGPGDPVLGEGLAAGRLAAELPDPGRRRSGAGPADPGPRAVARTASTWRSRR